MTPVILAISTDYTSRLIARAGARSGEPVGEAHKYRTLRDFVITIGQYDPQTGTVKRISENTAALRPRNPRRLSARSLGSLATDVHEK